MKKIIASSFLVIMAQTALAEFPSSFSQAKKFAEKHVYFDHLTTFYCECDYVFDDNQDIDQDGNTHETMIYPSQCGYIPRNPVTSSGKQNARTSRIEWEHIMLAHLIGGHLDQWKNKEKYSECKKPNGKYKSGRDCAYDLVPEFRKAHDDINNLTPAIGELNGDRSNYAFSNITGEKRSYGACDFEVDFSTKRVEPMHEIKGDIARVYFYMQKQYGAEVSTDTQAMMLYWDKLDPVDSWECLKADRIRKLQGLGNQFVLRECRNLE